MSTLAGDQHLSKIKDEADLAFYFASFAKSKKDIRVGLEAEFFAVNSVNGNALHYAGPGGVQEILAALAQNFQYQPILEKGNIIALRRGTLWITLEPGAQMELSAPPVKNVFDIQQQIQKFLNELKQTQIDFPHVTWIAVGIQPFSGLADIDWVPKKRYAIMADYFRGRGELAHHMMKLTATNQVNFDYTGEENAMRNLRVALGITSIVTALFANSSFYFGHSTEYKTRRLEIWNHTDPSRSGLLLEFVQPEKKFNDYLRFILDIPLIFIVRNQEWIPVHNKTFRQFIHEGYEKYQATVGDFELHLSTAFPEVRIKQYLEVRGVDCQEPALIPAIAAFWKGILYDDAAAEQAWSLVSDATDAERLQLHQEVPKLGLGAQLGKRPILPIARELVEISCQSLARQLTDEHKNECIFLNLIREKIANPGKSPGEMIKEKWDSEFQQDPKKLIQYLSVFKPV